MQTAHDVKLQLQWAAAAGEPPASGAQPAVAPARGARQRSVATTVAWVAGVVAVAALVLASWALRPRRAPGALLQVPLPDELTLGDYWSMHAIAPDGRAVVASGWRGSEPMRLWITRLDGREPTPLPGTERAWYPAWSPDSRFIAYFAYAARGLYRIPAEGGPPTRLADAQWARGISWGRRDDIVFAPNASGPLFRVRAGGGTPEPITVLDTTRGQASHRFPCFLPDGEHFLYVALPPGPRGVEVFVGSLRTKKSKRIMEADGAPVYVEPGHLVFVQANKIVAQRFDLRRLEPVGERVAIADAPEPSDMTAEPVVSASRDGRLLFPATPARESVVEWLGRDGAPRGRVPLPAGDWRVLSLSPDARFAVARGAGSLWRLDLERGIPTRILSGARREHRASWSPDGRRLVTDVERAGGPRVVFLDPGGLGIADSLAGVEGLFLEVADWSRDGRHLAVAVMDRPAPDGRETSWNLWSVPLDGSGRPSPYLQTASFERQGRFSPDGRWLAFIVQDEGQASLFVDSYPAPGRRALIGPVIADAWVMWGPKGDELLYWELAGEVVRVPLSFEHGEVKPGTPQRLFHLPEGATGIDSRDGERFLVSRPSRPSQGFSLRLAIEWTELIRK
uniref:Dipeptidylpeptidase IV N-terminal domain-containing protein n=1 Tax=Eiseniibacteriota bacterium TaxID=2212470 RepID=A0A832MLT3_UNCEI